MRVTLIGVGTTGSHIARRLRFPQTTALHLVDKDPKQLRVVSPAVDNRVDLSTGSPQEVPGVSSFAELGSRLAQPPRIRVAEAKKNQIADVVILAHPCGDHDKLAAYHLSNGSHVISLSEDPTEVEALLKLDATAMAASRSLVVGAGFEPGLSCLLVKYASERLDDVEAISISKAGTAGPACARQHHRALKTAGVEWMDEQWHQRRGGSGRDLAWFPEPIGARDCYRGHLASPILLRQSFPNARRLTARLAATRRDRFTSWLPMLRKPHRDGGPGGLRVELRGKKDGGVETIIVGISDYPSVASASVATVAAYAAHTRKIPIGAGGLASWNNPGSALTELRQHGIKVAEFSGAT